MKSIWDWFLSSNRYLHFLGGMLIGLISDDVYCAVVAGTCTAGAMEFKDYQWGGKPDWIDFTITVVGTGVGYCIRLLVFSFIGL